VGVTLGITLREANGLRVFENRALSKIFGAKTDGVTGDWRKLQNEELHDFIPLEVIKEDVMGTACGTCGEEYKCIQSFGVAI
jgi:hypothetical protein